MLPENSALVEYARYNYLSPDTEEDAYHYVAVVVTPDGQASLYELGDASPIDDLVSRYRQHMLQVSSAGRMPTPVDRQVYLSISSDIYDRIWRPLFHILGGRDLVFVAPDGALNSISFAGLSSGNGVYLAERLTLHRLSSGRSLLRFRQEAESGLGLLALGDPDYDATAMSRATGLPGGQASREELAFFETRNPRSGCIDLMDLRVNRLPGTGDEIRLVAETWENVSDEPADVLLGPAASEDRFKAEAPGKRVIHLATHGFFGELSCRSEREVHEVTPETRFVGENPLLLSGLLLAGANLHGEGADSLGMEDGILTAYEVSSMDLEGCRLVVLSGCETAMGRVEAGEGVFGLRRAFQMAGVGTVVSALWPVSDRATAELMGKIYSSWSEGLPHALRRIHLNSLHDLRQANRPDHPFTWAAFDAMGDWR
jgi:CHAT domain-containing protein